MTEIQENVKEALEGEYQFQPNQEKLFRNLQSAADYCVSFGIRGYTIQDVSLSNGTNAVLVRYQRNH